MSHSLRLRRIVLAAAAALALVPATASAITITYDDDTLIVRATDGGETVSLASHEPGRLSVSSDGAPIDFPSDRCEQYDTYAPANCEIPAKIQAELGDGDDRLTVFPGIEQSVPILVKGEEGADELKAIDAPGDLTLDGGPGEDVLTSENGADALLGGPGNDKLTGNDGADELRGGDGDDQLTGADGDGAPDVLDGGAGTDHLYEWGTMYDALVTVSMDGQANDGKAGEGDDVRDVESVETYVAGTFTLSDGADRFANHAHAEAAPTTIAGRGGDDVITGGRSEHRIDGGAGNDRIEGGWGHDTLTGGPGRDDIFGDSTAGNCGGYGQSCTVPFGNDTIDARDGEVDNVDCGVGEDTALVDRDDRVTGCEKVNDGQVPCGCGPDRDDRVPGDGPVSPSGTPRVQLAGKAKLRKALRSGLKVRLSGLPAGVVKVVARSAGKTVASGRATVAADGTATVTLKFTRAARRKLARKPSVRLAVLAGAAKTDLTLKR
ncbi:MAG: hypothetical protein M3389_07575 [Actinomycetota bacterium]|nr:hypothetical protein [Actinomycetota bacterium]